MKNRNTQDKFGEMGLNLARHNLEVTLKRTKEQCFRAAVEMGLESAEEAKKMDAFVRKQYWDEPRKMAEWDKVMQKYELSDEDEELRREEEERQRRISELIAQGEQTVRELDPIVRETFKDDPAALAEWDEIMHMCDDLGEEGAD